MTDENQSPSPTQAMPAPAAVAPAPIADGLSVSPVTAAPVPLEQEAAGGDRPELVVGGAFAAGFVIAMILKRLGN